MPQIKPMVYTALFVSLIACGAFMAIPIGPVPIVLQNMFILLAGLILGPRWGLACVGVYLLMGLAGLPVFAGGTAGMGRLFGPTGGYLLGYLPAAYFTGLVSQQMNHTLKGDLTALVLGIVIIFAAGVPWLKFALALDWAKAASVGMLPFLPGAALKIAAAAFMARKIRPRLTFSAPAMER